MLVIAVWDCNQVNSYAKLRNDLEIKKSVKEKTKEKPIFWFTVITFKLIAGEKI